MNKVLVNLSRNFWLALAFGVFVVLGLASQVVFSSSSGPAPLYYGAFHFCDVTSSCLDPDGHFAPWRTKVAVAKSDNGLNWEPVPGIGPFTGNMPDPIVRDDTLYVYYLVIEQTDFAPETLWVRRYGIDSQTWSEGVAVTVRNAAGEREVVVDPSLIVDEKGRLVLFYLWRDLATRPGGGPATCRPDETSCVRIFRSATEVENSQGTGFVVDDGNRFEATITSEEAIADPDIFRDPEGFVLYLQYADFRPTATAVNNVMALRSNDLRETYNPISGLTNGILSAGEIGVASGYYDPVTRQYWTFGHQRQPDGGAIIRRAVHGSLDEQIPPDAFQTVIESESSFLTLSLEGFGFAAGEEFETDDDESSDGDGGTDDSDDDD